MIRLSALSLGSAVEAGARQTGQQCAACHNGFPELTPYGRQVKLNGYTFNNNNNNNNNNTTFKSSSSAPGIPLAALLIDSNTHTDQQADEPVVPGTSRNNNLVMDAFALFYAGKIKSNVGARGHL